MVNLRQVHNPSWFQICIDYLFLLLGAFQHVCEFNLKSFPSLIMELSHIPLIPMCGTREHVFGSFFFLLLSFQGIAIKT
jgi:hypothetical protein